MLFLSKWKEMNTIVFFMLIVLVLEGVSQFDRFSKCGWNVTEHGCPQYDDDSWKCLRAEARCPRDKAYHCARKDWNRGSFQDGCYRNITCDKGKEPYILSDWDVKCDWCNDPDYYNSKEQISSTYSKCEEKKVKCFAAPIGVECQPESDSDKYTKNRRCRCDARNNYVMQYFDEIKEGVCTNDSFLASRCQRADPCGENKERLLNYTCAEKCVNGYRPKYSDECIPIVSTTEAHVRTPPPEPSVVPSLSTIPTTESSSSSSTFHVPKSTMKQTFATTQKLVIYEPKKYKITTVILAVILGMVVVVFVIVMLCIYKRRKKKARTKDTCNQNGRTNAFESISMEENQDDKANYEVRILVKKEYDFAEIEKARPNIENLEITGRLRRALLAELSHVSEILDITVKDLRQGSLLVIYIIQTQMSFLKSDLRVHLDKLVRKGAMGEFPIGNIRLIPPPRRDSIIDILEIPVEHSGRRRSIRRSYSQLSSMLPSPSLISQMSNGIANIPKAQHENLEEEPLLEDSGISSPMKNDVSDTPETPQTPVFTLDSPPVIPDSQRSLFSNNTKVPCDTNKSCDKTTSKVVYNRIRRISSSHNDLSLMEQVQQKQAQPIQKHKSQQYLPSDPVKRDEIAKTVLRKHYDELLSCLQPDRVLDKFIQIKGFMTETDIRDIREKKDTSEKNRCIIDWVIRKGYNGYKVLKDVIHSVQLELSNLEKDERELAKQIYEALETQKKDDTDSDDVSET